MKYVITVEFERAKHKTLLAKMLRAWAADLKNAGTDLRRWGKVSSDGQVKIEIERTD
jgi:hypothetical protein